MFLIKFTIRHYLSSLISLQQRLHFFFIAAASCLLLRSYRTSSLFINTLPTTTSTTKISTCLSSTTLSMTAASRFRSVKRILPAPSPHWVGDGFQVFPVFADLAFTEELSPMLMFDYGAPKRFPAKPPGTKPLGVGQHPHRGFETVSIAFQGEVEHHDSVGNTGVIRAGDVQWMTAGRGIIHQEYHSKEFTKAGGTFEMCQLWVNLPKKDKMTPPRYQSILNAQIPVVPLPLDTEKSGKETLGSARIIAGELGTIKGPAKTFSAVQVWDVSLPRAGSELELPYPSDHNCIVFVRRGSVEVVSGNDEDDKGQKANRLGPQDVALMQVDGSGLLKIRVLESNSSILVMGGEPLNEPIAAQGPFVMNDQSEIRQAMADYRSGRLGQ